MRVAAVVSTLVAVLGIAACGGRAGNDVAVPAAEPPAAEPDVVGVVTEVVPFQPVTEGCVTPDPGADPDVPVSSTDPPFCTDPDSPVLGTVLVEEDPDADSGDIKITFTVEAATTLLREGPDGYRAVSFRDLAPGLTVAAWADGPIAESYPAQAGAAALVVRSG
ncbi:MAG: hypothetical protein ICV70_04115 [Jiangellaceae bacterium]|nr:hypothetical protein [Jiangellaceae bacterium]